MPTNYSEAEATALVKAPEVVVTLDCGIGQRCGDDLDVRPQPRLRLDQRALSNIAIICRGRHIRSAPTCCYQGRHLCRDYWRWKMDGPSPGRASARTACRPGELVFNTSMTGYQEILTDPSYHKQIVTMTVPHVGNTGINPEDVESDRVWVAGFVVRALSPIGEQLAQRARSRRLSARAGRDRPVGRGDAGAGAPHPREGRDARGNCAR